MTKPSQGKTGISVVVLDTRLGPVVPVAAVPVLRAATKIYLGDDVPEDYAEFLGAEKPATRADLIEAVKNGLVVVVSASLTDPLATAAQAMGAEVIATPTRTGLVLLEAVDVMDRKYSPGGCTWSQALTHDSLRKYLLEECYELLEAIESGDRDLLRSELGDVLLQLLYHARIAENHETDPFDIDAVAESLIAKQRARSPHIFLDEKPELDSASVDLQWAQAKKKAAKGKSITTGIVLGQPALALVAKLVRRAQESGIPSDLGPEGNTMELALFNSAAAAELGGDNPELLVRSVAKRFMADIQAAELAAAEAGLDAQELTEQEWRKFWPTTRAT